MQFISIYRTSASANTCMKYHSHRTPFYPDSRKTYIRKIVRDGDVRNPLSCGRSGNQYDDNDFTLTSLTGWVPALGRRPIDGFYCITMAEMFVGLIDVGRISLPSSSVFNTRAS